MVSRDILNSHPVATLKKEISKTNVKGYSKMKKGEIIELMMKTPERFAHITMKGKQPRKKAEPKKKEEPKKAEPALSSSFEDWFKSRRAKELMKKSIKKGKKRASVKEIESILEGLL
jgi:hypothetical protein